MAKNQPQPQSDTPTGIGGNPHVDKAVQERDRQAVEASSGVGLPGMQTTYYKPQEGQFADKQPEAAKPADSDV